MRAGEFIGLVVSVVVGVPVTIYFFANVQGCLERQERARERLECLRLNSGKPTAELTRICGEPGNP